LTKCVSQFPKRALPAHLSRCFQMLLLEKDIDVNFVSMRNDGQAFTPISQSYHPECSILLIRAGAKFNQRLLQGDGDVRDEIQSLMLDPAAPFMLENLRIFVENGARLLENSPGISGSLSYMTQGIEFHSSWRNLDGWYWSPPEVWDLVLQLAQHQGLKMAATFDKGVSWQPLLHFAASKQAHVWILRKLLAADPQATKAMSKVRGNEFPTFSYLGAEENTKMADPKFHSYYLEVFELFLDHGADLESFMCENGEKKKIFFSMSETLLFFPELESKVHALIIKKLGKKYFQRLMNETEQSLMAEAFKRMGKM
jgi:hypothetical protein